jgi:hypothetical protein
VSYITIRGLPLGVNVIQLYVVKNHCALLRTDCGTVLAKRWTALSTHLEDERGDSHEAPVCGSGSVRLAASALRALKKNVFRLQVFRKCFGCGGGVHYIGQDWFVTTISLRRPTPRANAVQFSEKRSPMGSRQQ